MILAFLSSIPESELRAYRRIIPSRAMTSHYLINENGTVNFFEMLRKVTRLTLALTLDTSKQIDVAYFNKYATSVLFSLAYNADIAFKVVPSFTELRFPRGRAFAGKNVRNSDIEPPQLLYLTELIEQYNLALSSDDSFVRFIAYYHIMEYFFDDVYNRALIDSVREILVHPGFSSKRPKEISKIIDVVRKKTRSNKDEYQGTELEALELTIRNYVSLERLRDELNSYDSDLVRYYCTHEISFSNGDTIDLNDFENEKLPKKVAARIYKTRNSLVHHKSNSARVKERGVYHPFKDDAELSKEIILMRLIAEMIIIKSAQEI